LNTIKSGDLHSTTLFDLNSGLKYGKQPGQNLQSSIYSCFARTNQAISECFRLDYLAKEPLTFGTLKPYLLGALVCAISCLAMAIFSFYAKSKVVTGIAVFTVSVLVFLKIKYSL
jgi:hypothetical protein